MNNQRNLFTIFYRAGFGLLLALLCWLAPGRAAAAPLVGGPLPLPDLLIYGVVVNSTGDALESGTVKVLLNGQTLATAEIGAVAGTDYAYLLVAPMGMLPPGSTDSADGVARVGDTLSFYVNDQPAYYQDSITSLTTSTWQIPAGAPGRGFVLDLSLPGAMRYTLGDVNANGARNAADAMLTLKYDIGLIIGVTSFPPGPNTVYLPLCDIVENGRCDSSDALRILQCDVGMNSVECPVDTIPGARSAQGPTPGAATRLHISAAEETASGIVDVRVQLAGGAARYGAASFDLHYDPALFAPLACSENGANLFDLVACNPAFAPGVVRFNAIAAAGATDGAELVALRFQRLGAAEGELAARFALTADGVTAVDGADLPWDVTVDGATDSATDGATDSPAAGPTQHWLYLPAVVGQASQEAVEATTPVAPAESTPVEEPGAEATPAAPAEEQPVETAPLPAVQVQPMPTAEATPEPASVSDQAQTPAVASFSVFLPAVSNRQMTTTVTTLDAPIDEPPARDEGADAGEAAATPEAAAPLPATPVAALPPNEEQIGEVARPVDLTTLDGE